MAQDITDANAVTIKIGDDSAGTEAGLLILSDFELGIDPDNEKKYGIGNPDAQGRTTGNREITLSFTHIGQKTSLARTVEEGDFDVVVSGDEHSWEVDDVDGAMTALRARAARQGYDPNNGLNIPNPEGFITGKVTVQQSGDKVERTWKRMSPDSTAMRDAFQQWVQWLSADACGKAPNLSRPERTNDDLLAAYPIFDTHFGLYSHVAETGENFDLHEAERRVCGIAERLVSGMPQTDTALIILGGDIYHINDGSHETPASGHPQDVDTRFAKVALTGFYAVTYAIECARANHGHVYVKPIKGNHDEDAVIMLAIGLSAYFRDDERVTVEVTPSTYSYFRFGNVLIGVHHGHGAKMNDLPLLMAADRPGDWGATTHRYWYCGHIHHRTRDKEHPGAMVETFNTVTGTDAWHHHKGYRHTAKNMQAILHHAEDGEIERHTCSLSRLNRITEWSGLPKTA